MAEVEKSYKRQREALCQEAMVLTLVPPGQYSVPPIDQYPDEQTSSELMGGS